MSKESTIMTDAKSFDRALTKKEKEELYGASSRMSRLQCVAPTTKGERCKREKASWIIGDCQVCDEHYRLGAARYVDALKEYWGLKAINDSLSMRLDDFHVKHRMIVSSLRRDCLVYLTAAVFFALLCVVLVIL